MKHTAKITAVLLGMFLITQLIGLYVVNYYTQGAISFDGEKVNVTSPELPYGLESPELETSTDFNQVFVSIVIAFIIAISLLLFLMHFKAEVFLRLWFFLVVVIAISIALNAIIPAFKYSSLLALAIALLLAYFKLFKRYILVHNLTELIIYPGIAAVFVPILNFFTIVLLLIIISVYDMWAVWHSGIMQKMAKYQMNQLKLFSGFFVPYLSSKQRAQVKAIKQKTSAKNLEKKKIKVNVAILGGGDVIFPIIAAGVMLKTFGFVSIAGINIPLASLLVILGAAFGLGYLFMSAEKKKFYPAMPFISAGIFLGMALSWIIYTQILDIAVTLWPLF